MQDISIPGNYKKKGMKIFITLYLKSQKIIGKEVCYSDCCCLIGKLIDQVLFRIEVF